jgi:hypothetical protein
MDVSTLSPGNLGGLRVQQVSAIDYTFNMLIYGEWGVGKTFFAGQADSIPEMRKVLFVDVEGGTLSLRKDFPKVDLVRVKTWAEVQTVYNALHAGGHPYRTIVIDSLTEAQKFNMDQIMFDLIQRKSDEGKARDIDIPSLQEWGKNQNQIRRFVRAFRDLPVNTIFTALMKEDKDNMMRIVKTVDLSGKLGKQIPAFLDYVFYYYKKEIETDKVDNTGNKIMRTARVMLTQGNDAVLAKARVGLNPKLPKLIVDPSMAKVWNYLKLEEENIKNV